MGEIKGEKMEKKGSERGEKKRRERKNNDGQT
jgi:hypothetical protein